MKTTRANVTFTFFGILSLAFVAGCEQGFVTEAARTSLSSFVIDIISTAVDETIGPDD